MVSRRTPLSPKKRQLSGIVGGLGLGSSNGNGNGNSGGNGNNQNALAASSVDAATVATTPAAATVPVGATTPAKTAVATTYVIILVPSPPFQVAHADALEQTCRDDRAEASDDLDDLDDAVLDDDTDVDRRQHDQFCRSGCVDLVSNWMHSRALTLFVNLLA
jgi:hypothetical protein